MERLRRPDHGHEQLRRLQSCLEWRLNNQFRMRCDVRSRLMHQCRLKFRWVAFRLARQRPKLRPIYVWHDPDCRFQRRNLGAYQLPCQFDDATVFCPHSERACPIGDVWEPHDRHEHILRGQHQVWWIYDTPAASATEDERGSSHARIENFCQKRRSSI